MRMAFVVAEHDSGYGAQLRVGRSLEAQGVELEYIIGLAQRYPWRIPLKLKSKFYTLRHRRYTRSRDKLLIKDYARQLAVRLRSLPIDGIISPYSLGSQPTAYLRTDKPIFIWSDTTFAGALDFYPEFSSEVLCRETIRDAIENERAALDHCAAAIYTSHWAAEAAVHSYNLPQSKVHVVQYGPCLDYQPDFSPQQLEDIISARSTESCRILFVGKNWYRKGADIAVDVVHRLNQMGTPAQLTIVGSLPELGPNLPSYIEVEGYVDKTTPAGLQRIVDLMKSSHFLILPSRAECVGNVLAEANSFAVPCLASRVGGQQDAVVDHVNGLTVPHGLEAVDAYAAFVRDYFGNPDRYARLARSSYNEYATRLNWNHAGQAVKRIILEACGDCS